MAAAAEGERDFIGTERRKICSPRRQPWVTVTTDNVAAEKLHDLQISRGAAKQNHNQTKCFAPPGLVGMFFIDPMAHAMGYRSFAAPRLVEADHLTRAVG